MVLRMKIYLGADHAGYALKDMIASLLGRLGFEVEDLGTNGPESVDYPVYALNVARAVAADEGSRGILVCGTGMGMCISANKIRGIRAVIGYEPFSARMSRRHNDSNVLCVGARFTGSDLALRIVEEWLNEKFEGGRHKRRIDLIEDLSKDQA